MTSARQIATNRRNAARSTGPRTADGKKRSSANSLRHGLARALGQNTSLATDIEQIACAFANGRDPCLLYHARGVTEAQLEIVRVRQARVHLIDKIINNRVDSKRPLDPAQEGLGPLAHPDPKVAYAMKRLLRKLGRIPFAKKKATAAAYSIAISNLAAFDRYEQRALSRRSQSLHALVDAKNRDQLK